MRYINLHLHYITLHYMGQRHVCTFRHAQRAAYRTAISAAQILVHCYSVKAIYSRLGNGKVVQYFTVSSLFVIQGRSVVISLNEN